MWSRVPILLYLLFNIGTHSGRIHDLLKDHFIHEGWVLTIDYPGALDMDHPSGFASVFVLLY
jgi:hypothetical protein